jgi:arylsulfatase A
MNADNKTHIDRREFLKAPVVAGTLSSAFAKPQPQASAQPPNIIIIYADDLGYGDLGCYGSKIRTPHINQMAREGVRFRQFHSASPVCSPARAALLTGRYPTRSGVPRVLQPGDLTGLSPSETTIAQMLKTVNYKTMCIGKWHLGDLPQFSPNKYGFDEYYGMPYSVDMWPLPLMHNSAVLESPTVLSTLTPRYTAQAQNFINNANGSPFFLYMAHAYPHIPVNASDRFRGKSALGIYGDAIEEIDWSVGQVLATLKTNGLDNNTLVMFSSDHGPWYQGSAGKLRGRKGETWEGGVRVPLIARFPGQIPVDRTTDGVSSTLDILPTVARLANAPLPNRSLDGVDIWPLLTGEKTDVDREALLYFDSWQIQCARLGRWKLHVARYNSIIWTPDPPGGRFNLPLIKPELYDVETDPDESCNVASANPQIVADLQSRIARMIPSFPQDVVNAWRDTVSTKVQDTPVGALPVKA